MTLSICAAAWFGLLCAISPCPLAANIAAVGVVARNLSPGRTLFAGLSYAVGRALVSCALAAALVAGLSSAPELSQILQKHMNRVLGPLLVLVAGVLLGLVRLPSFGTGGCSAVRNRLAAHALLGPFLLGALFALAFCPTSAALYFGSLIPLAVERNSPVLLPAVFGFAAALPVVAVAVLLTCGVRKVGILLTRLTALETHLRRATGLVLLAIGIALTIQNNF